MSTPATPLGDRLSRRSRYEALVSKYEAAAEVVRTHADTDVQLQPQDQPIAEEEPEPQQLQRSPPASPRPVEIEADAQLPPTRSTRLSMGGIPSMAPLSPLLRRGSSAIPPADGGGSGGGAPIDDYSPAAATAHGGGEACEHGRAEPPCDGDLDLEKGAAGSNNGLLRRQVSGGSGGGRDGSPFAAAAVGAAVASGHGTHRKPRGEKQKKAPLVSTYWLKIDFMGRDTMIRVDKHKLMHKLGVQARDLRLLDLTSATPPAILGRDKAIIVNLWYMKAIITLDYCLVVSPDSIADNEERQAVATFVAELKAKLQPVSAGQKFKSYVGLNSAAGYGSLQLPFELKVLEVCLDMTAAKLEQDSKKLEGDAYPDLDALSHKVNAINLERARRIKNWLVRRTRDVESVREVLERFLNDDGDMHRLHLTGAEMSRQVSMRPGDLSRLSAGLLPMATDDSDSSSDSSIDEAETAAVEMLLEAYFMQIDHTYNRLQNLDEYIKDTEDLVTIKLDQHRNQLITIDLLLTSFTVVLNLMTVVGGYFGMNLNSNLQEEPHLFKAVVLSTTLGGIALFVAFLIFLARQKLLVY